MPKRKTKRRKVRGPSSPPGKVKVKRRVGRPISYVPPGLREVRAAIEWYGDNEAGGAKRMAKKCGVPESAVSFWRNGRRPMPAIHAIAIEIDSKGKFKAEKLSPTYIGQITRLRQLAAQADALRPAQTA